MSDKIISYKASKTGAAFHRSDAFVKGIMGPFGSGKSVACCMDIFMRAKDQTPGDDGIRRSRWIVARNTQPQLETTTIRTWLDWFPEHIFGKMSRKPPFTHKVKFGDVELEVIFLALDKPEDVKKLLSFEVTGIWFNEAREMDYELLSGATGRVGRYPPKKEKPASVPDSKWPKWHGIIMDTNPPTDDHWWYKAAEEGSWAKDAGGNPIDPETIPVRQQWQFFKQPSGLSKEAENIENLPGGYNYYKQQLGGKTEEWINVYVHGNYGFIKQGQPVYKGAWNPDIHTSKQPIKPHPSGTICIGIDASGRHPAAIFAQKTLNGQVQILSEFCVQDDAGMGATTFARALKQEMQLKYPHHDFDIWGDPAGAWGSQNDERTYFDILRASGINIKPSPGLRIPERVETVITALNTNVQGQPVISVSPNCKVLLRGMNGGYRYKKLNVSGESRYEDKPEKNRYSDVQDALQYMLCGMGMLNRMYGRKRSESKTVFAKSEYRI